MLYFKIVSFAFMASILVAEVLPFVNQIKYALRVNRLKPFDCALCLSFWISLFTSLHLIGFNFNTIWVSCVSLFTMYVFQHFKMYSK